MPEIILKKDCERRLKLGHLWVFSNEIAEIRNISTNGEIVEIRDHRGSFVGKAYLNQHSLISCRILSYQKENINKDFFRQRIKSALERRQRLLPGLTSYRLIHSEGDFLPGLIIDKYADTICLQTLTLGMELWKDIICDILEELLAPKLIIERNDSTIRILEGMQEKKGILRGEGETKILIEENNNRFMVDLLEGQKTGFFLDQRENRLRLSNYVKGQRALDCFCYSGAWSVAAAKAGAQEVVGVDISPKAIELAAENAKLNEVSEVCKFIQADVFEFLRNSLKEGEKFDLIILDPPAFVKSKKELKNALTGYREINLSAMKLLKDNGILITSSCSYHIDKETFIHVLVKSGEDARKMVRLLELRTQGRDHPILLPMRETEYLKCAIVEVNHKP